MPRRELVAMYLGFCRTYGGPVARLRERVMHYRWLRRDHHHTRRDAWDISWAYVANFEIYCEQHHS